MPQRKVLSLGHWSLGQQGNHIGPLPIPKLARPHGGTFRTWLLIRFQNEALANTVHGHPRLPPWLPFLSLKQRQCESLTFSHPLSKLSTLNWPCWGRGTVPSWRCVVSDHLEIMKEGGRSGDDSCSSQVAGDAM